MFVEYYGLQAPPFQLTPDHRFFFNSSGHARARAYLTYDLSQAEGFIVITGDVGAGKTTLVGQLLSNLDTDRFVAANIVTSQLSADDTLRMVASEFQVPYESAEKAVILERLSEFFADHQANNRRCLLVVDEAQTLSIEALEELRMLSNFQTNGRAQLQSFLLGQPQFRQTLARHDLDQFRQRIIASYHLGPMSPDETAEYVRHRLRAVGWEEDPKIDAQIFGEIHSQTAGVPRRINVLCSRLLLFGCLEERHDLGRDDVVQVAEDLRQETDSILDDSPPVNAVAAARGAVVSPSVAADIARLEERLVAVETGLRRRDRAWRQAMLSFSDILQTLSIDFKPKNGL